MILRLIEKPKIFVGPDDMAGLPKVERWELLRRTSTLKPGDIGGAGLSETLTYRGYTAEGDEVTVEVTDGIARGYSTRPSYWSGPSS